MQQKKIGLKLMHQPLLSLEFQRKKSNVKSKTKRRKCMGEKEKKKKETDTPMTLEANTKRTSKSKS
jgi:hypothetical protein